MAFTVHHTSGHAHPEDLMRMVRAMAPKRLIPIHTQFPEQYATLFPNVEIFPNDEWVSI
jgi:ribonuclease J